MPKNSYLGALDTETQDGRAFIATWCRGGPGHVVDLTDSRGVTLIPAGKYLTYNMDYDARALLLTIPGVDFRRLHLTKRDATSSGYKVYYDPGRECVIEAGAWKIALYDLAQHFGTSLRNAARMVGLAVQKSTIPKSWYTKMRDVFAAPGKRWEKILFYALRDAEVTYALGVWLWKQYVELGVPAVALSRPLSAGSLAARFFRKQLSGMNIPNWAAEVARQGYAGGRIEVLQRGSFPRVWIYDLKSAYPSVMAKLPDPRGLQVVVKRDGVRPWGAVYGVERVAVTVPEKGTPIVPAPLRNYRFGKKDVRGVRIYPVGRFTAWLTMPETDNVTGKVLYGIYLCGTRKPWPLGLSVKRLFAMRAKRPGVSYAIKILLNSLYGKLAQHTDFYRETDEFFRGVVQHKGKFYQKDARGGGASNVFVAAYITALTRINLWNAAEADPDHVIAYMTDSIIFDRRPRYFRTGKGLGDWECQYAGVPAVIVGTGVYSVKSGGKWRDKVRGYRTPDKGLIWALKHGGRGAIVKVRTRHAYTVGDAVTQGVPLNAIVDVARALDLNFDKKRYWPRPWRDGRDLLGKRQRSQPWRVLEGKG